MLIRHHFFVNYTHMGGNYLEWNRMGRLLKGITFHLSIMTDSLSNCLINVHAEQGWKHHARLRLFP